MFNQLLRHKIRPKIQFSWSISRLWRSKTKVGSELKACPVRVFKELVHRLQVVLLLATSRFSRVWQGTDLPCTLVQTRTRRKHILLTLIGENELKSWWAGFSSFTSFRSLRHLVLSLILRGFFRPLSTHRIMSKRPASLRLMLWKTTWILHKIENRHLGNKMSRLFLRSKNLDKSWTKDAKSFP